MQQARHTGTNRLAGLFQNSTKAQETNRQNSSEKLLEIGDYRRLELALCVVLFTACKQPKALQCHRRIFWEAVVAKKSTFVANKVQLRLLLNLG